MCRRRWGSCGVGCVRWAWRIVSIPSCGATTSRRTAGRGEPTAAPPAPRPSSQQTGLTYCTYLPTYLLGTEPTEFSRVADPVHFRPDPYPANQKFLNRIRILPGINRFSSDIFILFFFTLTNLKIYLNIWKARFLKSFVGTCLYRGTTLHSQGTLVPDPVSNLRIQRKRSGFSAAEPEPYHCVVF